MAVPRPKRTLPLIVDTHDSLRKHQTQHLDNLIHGIRFKKKKSQFAKLPVNFPIFSGYTESQASNISHNGNAYI